METERITRVGHSSNFYNCILSAKNAYSAKYYLLTGYKYAEEHN
jgi:hypothetical protein